MQRIASSPLGLVDRSGPHLAGAKLTLHYGDPTDSIWLRRVLETIDPAEVVATRILRLIASPARLPCGYLKY